MASCFAPPHGANPSGAAFGWLSRSARLKHSLTNTLSETDQWLRGRLRGILRKRDGRKGRGRGLDHHRYPNRYFAELGLFNLEGAKRAELRSST